jgi:integrase
MQVLDETETATLLGRLENSRLYIPVLLAITTGLRRGEILGMRWSDVDLSKGSVMVVSSLERTVEGLKFKSPKTHRSRRAVALPPLTIDALRTHRAEQAADRLAIGPNYNDNGLVCPAPGGSPWRPDAFSASFAKAIRRMDVRKVRFHDLRHSHATHLLRAGVHPKVVSERLGHSSVGITLDTYSHVLPGMQQDAVKLIDAALVAAIRHDKAAKE